MHRVTGNGGGRAGKRDAEGGETRASGRASLTPSKLTASELLMFETYQTLDLKQAQLIDIAQRNQVENPLWNQHQILQIPKHGSWRRQLWVRSDEHP